MSEYRDSQLTDFGSDLAQRASNGDTKFAITKVTSTADDLSQTDFSKLVSLPNEKQIGEIDRILPDPNGGTAVKGTKASFDNLNVSESYPIWAIGLYAKEDVDGAKEQLYAVTIASDPETMPKSDSTIMFTFAASIYVVVGNTNQVTINVNPDGFATKEYVADAIANVKIDTSDLAKLSQDNYYTGDNQFKYDPVNKNGDSYGLAKDIATKVTDNGDNSIEINKQAVTPVRDNKNGSINFNSKDMTPADDSKVVHDNHDGTITADGTVFNLLNSLSASSIPQDPTKDYNTLPQGLALMSEINGEPANMPPVKSTYLTLTIASSFATGRKRQLAWLDAGANSFNNNYTYIRYCVGNIWSSWDSIPTSTQISSLIPSTIADTTKLANFTAGLQSGGVSVATSDDLKSVKESAWYMIPENNSNMIRDIGWMKRDSVNNYLYILYNFATVPWVPTASEMLVDLSSYVDALDDAQGYIMLSSKDFYSNNNIWQLIDSHRAMSTVWAKDATLITGSGFHTSDLNGGNNYLNLTTFDTKIDNNPWTNKCLRVHYNKWIGS